MLTMFMPMLFNWWFFFTYIKTISSRSIVTRIPTSKMAKTTIFVVLSLCAVLGVDAFNDRIPAGFFVFDKEFQLTPYQLNTQPTRFVFKFGDESHLKCERSKLFLKWYKINYVSYNNKNKRSNNSNRISSNKLFCFVYN